MSLPNEEVLQKRLTKLRIREEDLQEEFGMKGASLDDLYIQLTKEEEE